MPNSQLSSDQTAVEVVAAAFRPAGFAPTMRREGCPPEGGRYKTIAAPAVCELESCFERSNSCPRLTGRSMLRPLRDLATTIRLGEESGSKLPHSTELRRLHLECGGLPPLSRAIRGKIESGMPRGGTPFDCAQDKPALRKALQNHRRRACGFTAGSNCCEWRSGSNR